MSVSQAGSVMVSLDLLLSIMVPTLTLLVVLIGTLYKHVTTQIHRLEDRFQVKTDDIERNLRHRIAEITTSTIEAIRKMDNTRSDDVKKLLASLDETRALTQHRYGLYKRRSGERETRGINGDDAE